MVTLVASRSRREVFVTGVWGDGAREVNDSKREERSVEPRPQLVKKTRAERENVSE